MEKYKNDYVKLDYFAEKSLVTVEWYEKTEELSSEAFLEQVTLIADTVVESGAKYFLADETKMRFITDVDLQAVIAKKVLKKFSVHGLKKFAHICSTDIIANMSIIQTFDEDANKIYQEEFFDDLENGHEWIAEG